MNYTDLINEGERGNDSTSPLSEATLTRLRLDAYEQSIRRRSLPKEVERLIYKRLSDG